MALAPREAIEPSANGTIGRDARGRFVPGGPGGPGNPDGKRYAALKRAFLLATSASKITRLEQKLYEMALGGDVQAIKLYFSYALGSPDQHVDVDVTEQRDWAAETHQARLWLEQRISVMHHRLAAAQEVGQVRRHLTEGLHEP